MKNPSERPPDEIENMIRKYGNMLFRVCLVMLKSANDAEDAVQNTVLKYIQKAPHFNSAEHEKAWLIKVATSQCRDIQRFWLRHPQPDIEDLQDYVSDPESCGIIEALMTIPEKFKVVMLLYYVEEYRIKEPLI